MADGCIADFGFFVGELVAAPSLLEAEQSKSMTKIVQIVKPHSLIDFKALEKPKARVGKVFEKKLRGER